MGLFSAVREDLLPQQWSRFLKACPPPGPGFFHSILHRLKGKAVGKEMRLCLCRNKAFIKASCGWRWRVGGMRNRDVPQNQLHVCSLQTDTRLTQPDPWLKTLLDLSPPLLDSLPRPTHPARAIKLLSNKFNFSNNEAIMSSPEE